MSTTDITTPVITLTEDDRALASPGTDSGLTFDLPARFLDQAFGRGRVARFEDVDFPATLTHEPTRRFLRETGLPETTPMFQVDWDIPLPTLTEYYERDGDVAPHPLPTHSDHLIRLGSLIDDSHVLIDGPTGEILTWTAPDPDLSPLTPDVSALAFTLRLAVETAAGNEPA